MSKYDGTIWQDNMWYPPGLSWELVEKALEKGHKLATPKDLYIIPAYTIAIIIFRFCFEYCISTPLANYCLGSTGKKSPPKKSETLEKLYAVSNKFDSKTQKLPADSAEKSWSEREIQRWFRRRRNQDRPNLTKKFSETFFRASTYVFLWFWAVYALYDSEWLWDPAQCFVNFPFQDFEFKVVFLYHIELAFYSSLVLSLFTDVRRKDFTEQIIHHFATITLITFSYLANFIRVGSLVIILHDLSDIFLEAAKCFIYCKKGKIADVLFGIFAVTFLVTRDIMFPWMVLHTTMIKSMWMFEPYFAYYAFNAFLMIIQVLNWFWSFTILRMAYRLMTQSEIGEDDRSDGEETSSDEEDKKKQ